jgi:Spy/CpxP family protein refolding chaperone
MKEMMMQKHTRNILAGALLTAMPMFAFACDGGMGLPQMQGGMPPPSHMMNGMPPMGMTKLPPPLEELARLKALDLSDVQQKKVFDLIYAQAPAIFENDRIAHRTMDDLHQLGMSDKFDAARAKTLADEHSKAMTALIYMRAETESKIWAILTEPQRKHLLQHMGPPSRP